MSNVAQKIIRPDRPGLFRSVFLYTGQGESILMAIPTGGNVEDYMYILIDCDNDYEKNEIDLVSLFDDLFEDDEEIEVFINTHPHNDHIGGIKDVYDKIGIREVWHSNHKPGKKHQDKFEELKYVIEQVGSENEYHLLGTNDNNKVRKNNDEEIIKKLGEVDYIVLSPAEYVVDEIEGEEDETRYRRIHEQCAVLKFTYGNDPKCIMITGDSDKAAWQNHITDYHKDKLPAIVLSASHHGSRTFFKTNKDDKDVYEDHIKEISPEYVIVSAPAQEQSPHGHPDDDAMKLYEKYVGEDGVLHLGDVEYGPYSVIVDIENDGGLSVNFDKELIEEYGRKDNDDGNDNTQKQVYIKSNTKLDSQPMAK